MEVEAERQDKEKKEEEVTEEEKRFMMQEMAKGFSLFEEALLIFWGIGPEYESYTKVAAQNAIQCYGVILRWEKKSYYQGVTGDFFQEG